MSYQRQLTLTPTASLHETEITSIMEEQDFDFDTNEETKESIKGNPEVKYLPEPVKECAKEHAKKPDCVANLDLCFMLDCTASRQCYINRARDKIKEVIEEVKEQNPGSEIYVGIVGYRDVQDLKRFEVLPFTHDIEKARAFLDTLQAEGGGDLPEDVNGGFQEALLMEWKSDAKMILHIADAPCHGTNYHACGGDNHPDGYKDDAPWEAIFEQIVAFRIDYLFLKILPATDMMFEKFKILGESCGAVAHGVLFKQEPISLADAMGQNLMLGGGLFPAAPLFSTMAYPAVEKKKRGRPRKDASKEEREERSSDKKTRKNSRKKRSTSKSCEREIERVKPSIYGGGMYNSPVSGMTPEQEQEYFKNLLKKEMTESLLRKKDAKK